MNLLPQHHDLPISALCNLFGSTTNSYKFLIFKAILDEVDANNYEIEFETIAINSLAYAWYAIHAYKLNLGQMDQITKWINQIDDLPLLSSSLSYDKIKQALGQLKRDDKIKNIIKEYTKYVPYRILTPFFEAELRGLKDHLKNQKIATLSQNSKYKPLYKIKEHDKKLILTIHPEWINYLKINFVIIEGWWRYNYISYLQKKNPTVLAIASKLEFPKDRDMVLVKKLFNHYFALYPNKRRCLYTGLEIGSTISHDHFLPWTFLGSDPLYNFAPTNKSNNSSKSDMLPNQAFIKTLAAFHYQFTKTIDPKNFNEYAEQLCLSMDASETTFTNAYLSFYKPLYTTAERQGFGVNWSP